MKTARFCLWFLCSLLLEPVAVFARERVALVVGCGKYANLPGGQLVSPAADSAAVATAFRAMGYTVLGGRELRDPTREELNAATERFAAAARGAEAAVFYFCGHGMQVGEDTYLLPVDTPPITGLAQLKNRAVNVRNSVMVALEKSGVDTKVIVLDCCRDNPFSTQLEAALAQGGESIKTKSVGEMTGYGAGVYLAFATSLGKTTLDGTGGRNGLFASAFLKALETGADKDIDLLFRDVKRRMPKDVVTWTNSRLEREFSLSLVALNRPEHELKREIPAPAGEAASTAMAPVAEGRFAGEAYENGLGMLFRWCPAGDFLMGSSKSEQAMVKEWGVNAKDEVQRKVRLTRGYWMQEREVSQGDWRRVMGRGLREEVEAFLRSDQYVNIGGKMMMMRQFYGAKVGDDVGRYTGVEDDGYPMIYVDWEGARAYCEQLTELERRAGRLGDGWKYALPTEAQWEYASRAGSPGAVYAGEMKILGENNAPVLDLIAWYGGNSALGYPGAGIYFRGKVLSTAGWKGMAYTGGVCGPRRCGEKAANGWGLRDMLRNVWEWCGDWYGEYAVPEGGVSVDPHGREKGVHRVLRGGGWSHGAAYCRAAERFRLDPGHRDSDLGLRPALVPSR